MTFRSLIFPNYFYFFCLLTHNSTSYLINLFYLLLFCCLFANSVFSFMYINMDFSLSSFFSLFPMIYLSYVFNIILNSKNTFQHYVTICFFSIFSLFLQFLSFASPTFLSQILSPSIPEKLVSLFYSSFPFFNNFHYNFYQYYGYFSQIYCVTLTFLLLTLYKDSLPFFTKFFLPSILYYFIHILPF